MKCNTTMIDFPVMMSSSKLSPKKEVVVTLFPSGMGMSFGISLFDIAIDCSRPIMFLIQYVRITVLFGSVSDGKALGFHKIPIYSFHPL